MMMLQGAEVGRHVEIGSLLAVSALYMLGRCSGLRVLWSTHHGSTQVEPRSLLEFVTGAWQQGLIGQYRD